MISELSNSSNSPPLNGLLLARMIGWPELTCPSERGSAAETVDLCHNASTRQCARKLEAIIELLQALLAALESGADPAPRPQPETVTRTESPAQTAYGLTEREQEVLEQLIQGKSNRQIALALQITPATVKTHVSNMLAKMGVESRTGAVALALQGREAPVSPAGGDGCRRNEREEALPLPVMTSLDGQIKQGEASTAAAGDGVPRRANQAK